MLQLVINKHFGEVREPYMEIAQELLSSCYYMKDLISNLLFYNKITTQSLSYSEILFSELINKSAKEMKALFEEKNQAIKISNKIKKEKNIQADKLFLKRTIYNLITNAINYSFKNSEIEIIVSQTAKTTTCLIKSCGNLMSDELLENIFNYGVCGTKSIGNGIGLCIVKQVIDAHCGNIEARVENQKYNIFEFTIPNTKIIK